MPNEIEEINLYQLFHPQFSRNTLPSPPFPKPFFCTKSKLFSLPRLDQLNITKRSGETALTVPNAEEQQLLTGADTVTRPQNTGEFCPGPSEGRPSWRSRSHFGKNSGSSFTALGWTFACPSFLVSGRGKRPRGRVKGAGKRPPGPGGKSRSTEAEPGGENKYNRRTRGGRRAESSWPGPRRGKSRGRGGGARPAAGEGGEPRAGWSGGRNGEPGWRPSRGPGAGAPRRAGPTAPGPKRRRREREREERGREERRRPQTRAPRGQEAPHLQLPPRRSTAGLSSPPDPSPPGAGPAAAAYPRHIRPRPAPGGMGRSELGASLRFVPRRSGGLFPPTERPRLGRAQRLSRQRCPLSLRSARRRSLHPRARQTPPGGRSRGTRPERANAPPRLTRKGRGPAERAGSQGHAHGRARSRGGASPAASGAPRDGTANLSAHPSTNTLPEFFVSWPDTWLFLAKK